MDFIITTDTHFDHKNIMDFGNRPEGFEQQILDNLEQYANNTNILIHLGDIAWRNDRYWNRQLTSMPYRKKWLIKGNHDKKSNEWYINNGWDFVSDYLSMTYDNRLIVFSHKPTKLIVADINIHGHFHDIPMEIIKQIEPDLYSIYQEKGHVLLALEHHYTPYKLKHIVSQYDSSIKHSETSQSLTQ